LCELHFSLLKYKFPQKKYLSIKSLRSFYGSYIYTVARFNLNHCTVNNPYAILMNRFYFGNIKEYYLVNTEDNFKRFFLEYYFGHNQLLLRFLIQCVTQEFAIKNAFLLRYLREQTDFVKYKNYEFNEDEDFV
jgi:hypothetical protein